MKKFKNYQNLAASLITDLEYSVGKDNIWTGDQYGSLPNHYQAASKNTTAEQDELNIQSQIIYISEESFDSSRVVNVDLNDDSSDGSFKISSEHYQELLNQLILEFENLEINENGGYLRFN